MVQEKQNLIINDCSTIQIQKYTLLTLNSKAYNTLSHFGINKNKRKKSPYPESIHKKWGVCIFPKVLQVPAERVINVHNDGRRGELKLQEK